MAIMSPHFTANLYLHQKTPNVVLSEAHNTKRDPYEFINTPRNLKSILFYSKISAKSIYLFSTTQITSYVILLVIVIIA